MKRYLSFIAVFVLVLAPYIVGAHSTETAQLTTASTVQKVVVPKIKINTEISDQNTSFSTDSVLKPGAVAKQEVVLLQAFLYNQRIYNGSIDGVYGPKTKEAVKAFQSTTNGQLTVDGVAGPRTMSYIESLSKGEAVATTGTNTNNVSGSTNKISIPSLPKNVLTRALKPQSSLVPDTSSAAKKITSKPKSNFSVFSNVGIYNVAASGAQSGTNGSNLNTNFGSAGSTANTKYVCGVKDGVNQCYLLSLDEVAQIDSGTFDLEGVLAARAGGTTQVGNCPSVYVDENGNTSVTDQSWWDRTNACGGSAGSNNQNQIATASSGEACFEGKVINLMTAQATGALCPNGLSSNEEDSSKYLGVVKPQESDSGLVKEVQKALIALKYDVSADGVFGTQTKNEIIDFQKDKNLTPDGVIGRATFEALQNELNKKSTNISLLNNVIKIRNTAYEQENQNFITNVIKKQFDINKPKTWGKAVIDSPTSQWYVKNYGTDSRGKPRSFVVHTHTMPESAPLASTSNSSFSSAISSAFQSLAQVGSSQPAQAIQALNPTDGGAGTSSDIGQVYCKRITSTAFAPNMYSVKVIIGTDKIFWVKDSTPTLKYQIPNVSGPFPTMKILDGAGKSGLYFSYVETDNDGIPTEAIPSVFVDQNMGITMEVLNTDKIFTLSPDGKKYYSFDWSKLNDPNLPKCTMPSYGNGFIGVIGPDGTVKSVSGSTGGNSGGTIVPKQCSDGIDNDGDGKTDYPVDPGCSSSGDDSENSDGGGGGTPVTTDGTCTDGIKNGNEDSVDTGGSCEGGILASGTNHQQPVIDHVPGSGKPVLVNWQNVSVPASWEEYLVQTKKDWNLARKLKISLGGPGYTVPMHYRDDFKDDDGISPAKWIGAAWWYPASGGHQYQTEVGFNKKKMDELNLNTPEYIQFLVCHELGHSIGMGHADENNYNANKGTCADYSRAPGGGTHTFTVNGTPTTINFGNLENLHPSSIDIAAINSLYQHTH